MSMEYSRAKDWLFAQRRSGRIRTPQRARRLLSLLGLTGQPQRFVHVLGTNGKGSVAAYLEAAFIAAGRRAGAFSSPHLVDLRERIRVQGRQISEAAVVEFVAMVRPLTGVEATFFDLMLAMALWRFREEGVQWAALEAGVGGASDATMAVNGVAATIISNVAADHLATFGGFEALAADKARAARPGTPLLTAARGSALRIIAREAERVGAPLFVYREGSSLFSLPAVPGIKGDAQKTNAALASAALRLLGFAESEIAEGLQRARLSGRMDARECCGRRIILDAAHNPHAVRSLLRSLPASYHLLFGAQPHKDVAGMYALLTSRAISLTCTWPLKRSSLPGCAYLADPQKALLNVVSRSDKNEPVLVTGSFYLLGKLLGSDLFD